MTTSIQLSNIPHADGIDARRMYLTEAAQHDAEICINKISDNVVDAARFSDPKNFMPPISTQSPLRTKLRPGLRNPSGTIFLYAYPIMKLR